MEQVVLNVEVEYEFAETGELLVVLLFLIDYVICRTSCHAIL